MDGKKDKQLPFCPMSRVLNLHNDSKGNGLAVPVGTRLFLSCSDGLLLYISQLLNTRVHGNCW